MKKILVLFCFLSFGSVGMVRADQYCGDGLTCPQDATTGISVVSSCRVAEGGQACAETTISQSSTCNAYTLDGTNYCTLRGSGEYYSSATRMWNIGQCKGWCSQADDLCYDPILKGETTCPCVPESDNLFNAGYDGSCVGDCTVHGYSDCDVLRDEQSYVPGEPFERWQLLGCCPGSTLPGGGEGGETPPPPSSCSTSGPIASACNADGSVPTGEPTSGLRVYRSLSSASGWMRFAYEYLPDSAYVDTRWAAGAPFQPISSTIPYFAMDECRGWTLTSYIGYFVPPVDGYYQFKIQREPAGPGSDGNLQAAFAFGAYGAGDWYNPWPADPDALMGISGVYKLSLGGEDPQTELAMFDDQHFHIHGGVPYPVQGMHVIGDASITYQGNLTVLSRYRANPTDAWPAEWTIIPSSQYQPCQQSTTPPPVVDNSTCSITVSTLSGTDQNELVSVSATGTGGSLNNAIVRIFAEQRDGDDLLAPPTSETNTILKVNAFGETVYKLDECSASAGESCTASIDDLIVSSEDYYFHCSVHTDEADPQPLCSGNPFCSYEAYGGTVDCESVGYVSCSENDNAVYCSDTIDWEPDVCDGGTRTGTHFCSTEHPQIENDSCVATIQGTITESSTCTPGTPITDPLPSISYSSTDFGSYNDSADVLGGYSVQVPTLGLDQATTYRPSITNGTIFGLPGYGLVCPQTTPTISVVSDDVITQDYTVLSVSDAWFQVFGGSVMVGALPSRGGNGSIGQAIPLRTPTSYTLMQKYAHGNPNPTYGRDNTSGFPLIGEMLSDISLGNGSIRAEDEKDAEKYATLSTSAEKTGYAYLKQMLNLPAVPVDDFTNQALPHELSDTSLFTQPYANADADAFFASDTIVVNGDLTIPSSMRAILVVDGDVVIENQITVELGGFLMIVASGDISIDASLGLAEPLSADELEMEAYAETALAEAMVQGVYVADGTISTGTNTDGSGDTQFIGAGTFVGWQGFNLERNLSGIGNNDSPAEVFFVRPDLVLNAPDSLKKSTYDWFEIAP